MDNKDNTTTLLNVIDFNKPLEVAVVFEDSDEEYSCSNRQESKNTEDTKHIAKPIEVSTIIDKPYEHDSIENGKTDHRQTKTSDIVSDSLDGKRKRSSDSASGELKHSSDDSNSYGNKRQSTNFDLCQKNRESSKLINSETNEQMFHRNEKPCDSQLLSNNDVSTLQPIDEGKGGSSKSLDSKVKNTSDSEYVDCDNYLSLMLKTVSEHLIVILQAYNCFVSTKAADSNKILEAEKNFLKIKEHFYNLSYSTVSSIMLPQEKNAAFTVKFINDCVALSKNNFCYDQFLPLYEEMLQWVKIKKQRISELPFGKGFETLRETNPILSDQLSQSPSNLSKKLLPDGIKNNGNITSSIPHNQSLCIYSSGPNGAEVTIDVDPQLLNQQIQVEKVPPKSMNYVTTCNILPQINYNNKAMKSVESNLRSSPYPSCLPSSLHTVKFSQNYVPAQNSSVINHRVTNQASTFRPKDRYGNISPSYMSSPNLTQPVNYYLPPIPTSVARQAPPPYPLRQDQLPYSPSRLGPPYSSSTHNHLLKNMLQSDPFPPRSSPTTRMSQPHEIHFNPSSNSFSANYNSYSLTTARQAHPILHTAQDIRNNSLSGVLRHSENCNLPPISSPVYGQSLPASSSVVSPAVNSPSWQKAYELEALEEHDRSTRCRSADSGFASPFNLHSPAEMPGNQEIQTAQPTPLITHVTSLNPKAAYNNEGACFTCSKITKLKCLGCHKKYYCSFECQVKDWKRHERECKPL